LKIYISILEKLLSLVAGFKEESKPECGLINRIKGLLQSLPTSNGNKLLTIEVE
jgi:hypothetical protein